MLRQVKTGTICRLDIKRNRLVKKSYQFAVFLMLIILTYATIYYQLEGKNVIFFDVLVVSVPRLDSEIPSL